MDIWLLALELTVPIVFLIGALYLIWMADLLPRQAAPSRPRNGVRQKVAKLPVMHMDGRSAISI